MRKMVASALEFDVGSASGPGVPCCPACPGTNSKNRLIPDYKSPYEVFRPFLGGLIPPTMATSASRATTHTRIPAT